MYKRQSSHTAGAARLGKMARCIFRSTPKKVDLTLYGSFAKTYKGHGTDRALVGGLLGYKEDDTNIRIAHDLARKEGMEYTFIESPLDVGHPNVVRFDMYDDHNRHMTVIGRSLGGGQIMITEVDGNDTVSYTHLDVYKRQISTPHKDADYAKLEEEIMEMVNKTGIGPQLGGTTTCLGVNIEWGATHIAGLPVAVTIMCHAARHEMCIRDRS